MDHRPSCPHRLTKVDQGGPRVDQEVVSSSPAAHLFPWQPSIPSLTFASLLFQSQNQTPALWMALFFERLKFREHSQRPQVASGFCLASSCPIRFFCLLPMGQNMWGRTGATLKRSLKLFACQEVGQEHGVHGWKPSPVLHTAMKKAQKH